MSVPGTIETRTFNCQVTQGSATQQKFLVPDNVYFLDLLLLGGQGGSLKRGSNPVFRGGFGGQALAMAIPVTAGEELTIIVGCKGGDGFYFNQVGGVGGTGDGNGGKGGNGPGVADFHGVGGGGGGTSVSLGNSKLIAGGGGGAGHDKGGDGGGTNGGTGNASQYSGHGGTQLSPGDGGGQNQPNTISGNDGIGENGGIGVNGFDTGLQNSDGTGGGGGGLFGGGSGGMRIGSGGYSGGGGSGGKIGSRFANAVLTSGVNDGGNGSVVITYVVLPIPRLTGRVSSSSPSSSLSNVISVCEEVQLSVQAVGYESLTSVSDVMVFQVCGPYRDTNHLKAAEDSGTLIKPIAKYTVDLSADNIINNSVTIVSPSFVPEAVGVYSWNVILFRQGAPIAKVNDSLIFFVNKAMPILTCFLGSDSPRLELAGGCRPTGRISYRLLYRNKILDSEKWYVYLGKYGNDDDEVIVVDGNGLYCYNDHNFCCPFWYECKWEFAYSGDSRNYPVSSCFALLK